MCVISVISIFLNFSIDGIIGEFNSREINFPCWKHLTRREYRIDIDPLVRSLKKGDDPLY